MGTFAANILPTQTGLALGASNQEWNAWLNLLNGLSPVNFTSSNIPFTTAPDFVAQAVMSVITMTLLGDIVSSTFTGIPGLVIFQLTQDGVGNRAFVWPSNINGGSLPAPDANSVTTQMFFYDGTTGWPIGSATVFP